jgi:hypothetical protein
MIKQCIECKQNKILSEFHLDNRRKDKKNSKCKICVNKSHRERDEKIRNKEIIVTPKEFNPNTETEKFCTNCKKYKLFCEFNKNNCQKDKLQFHCKKCQNKVWEKDKDNIKKQRKNRIIIINIPDEKNCGRCKKLKLSLEFNKSKDRSDGLEWDCKECRSKENKKNRSKINARQNKQRKNPIIRLRRIVSSAISEALRYNKGGSCFDYLPYTIQELKQHIESQFESWMSWETYGRANINKKTWNIDHIIPQSALPYDNMKHPNFQKCWALENLRPLEAIENLKKGNKIIQ